MKTDIHIGDCRKILKDLPADAAHTCVTSPPYWGLRDYGNAGQLGLERSPEEYVENLVAVFREVKRVLRPDGTLWLNLGDTYEANQKGSGGSGGSGGPQYRNKGSRFPKVKFTLPEGLKTKDLCGIPWRAAFALQADGWWLRSSIIWAKGVSFCDTYSGSVMPESCRDRPTRAHENIFLLSKAPRYFYDADAVREKMASALHAPGNLKLDASRNDHDRMDDVWGSPSGRNLRNVWTINTRPLKDAHFATFPPKLIEPCVIAGCPEGGTCLDPFGGVGTVGLVSSRLQRNAILIELNPNYAEDIARKRIIEDAPMFNTVNIIRSEHVGK